MHSVKVRKNNKISNRTASYYLVSFTYLFVKALINYPHNIFLYTKSLIKFLVYSKDLFTRKLVFNHRDLNLGNFILNKDGVYIIDFQLAAVTVPEFEYASIVRSIIRDEKLTTSFIGHLKKDCIKSDSSLNSFKACLVYYGMMGLIDKRFPVKRTEDFISTLKIVDNI
jgi:thiamine kinase-like enzyme